MTLEPLLSATPPIPWHAIAALAALVIGATQFLLPKGTTRHRVVGSLWAALMIFIAASSFWISELKVWGWWSPIHILSIVTLVTVPLAVWNAHRHQIKAHRYGMISIYVLALVGAGLFTLLPGRIMHDVVWGEVTPPRAP